MKFCAHIQVHFTRVRRYAVRNRLIDLDIRTPSTTTYCNSAQFLVLLNDDVGDVLSDRLDQQCDRIFLALVFIVSLLLVELRVPSHTSASCAYREPIPKQRGGRYYNKQSILYLFRIFRMSMTARSFFHVSVQMLI